ncbi:hypothetical protein ACQRIU_006933 [Beauveria bassiana]
MGMRPTTQFQVGKDGYGVYDSDNGYGGDDAGQRERASDIRSAIPPVPPIRRLAPPRVVRQPAAAPTPKQEPVRVKEVVAVRAPVEGNPWAKDRYKKAYTTLDFDGDATVAVGARRVVLIRQFTAPDQRTVQLYLQLRHRNVVEVVEAFNYQANQEKLVPLTAEIESRDAAAVGDVALHLMQKDAGPGVRDSAQWHAFLNFVACAASAKGVAQLRGVSTPCASTGRKLTSKDQILADMSPDHERSLIALYYTAEPIMKVPSLYEIYAVILFAACASLLLCRLLVAACHFVAPIWCVLRRAAHKLQFRRLLRRHSLVGPLYTCKVITYAFVLALHAAVLSLELARTATSAFCVRLTTLTDAAARAKYLALLNLTVIYISPHHYGVADVFGVSLQLFRQVHRVAGLLSLCLLLFSVTVALADDPRRALETDEGRFGLMIIACMAALATASLAKTVAYEVFLKVHEISAALLAYLLLSRVLADPSFSRLPLYVYGGVAGLLNVYFMCRYGYYNFAGWHQPRLVCSEIAASRIHDRRWLHLELVVPRRVHARPGQYISVWIPGVQLLSSHPFATATTTGSQGTVFHLFVHPQSGMTKTLIRPLLPSAMTAGDLERQTIVVRRSRKTGPVVQTKQAVDQNKFRPRFALFTGPHGRSVDHRKFETVVLIASGFGYWSLDGYLEDMLRRERAATRTEKIVLVYKGKPPLMIEDAMNKRLRDDAHSSDDSLKLRLRVIFYPANRMKNAIQDGDKFSDMTELAKMSKFRPAENMEKYKVTNDTGKVTGLEVGNKGRLTFWPGPLPLKDVVDNPSVFENGVKFMTGQSSFDDEAADGTNTLILVSAENQLVDELKQVVVTSKKGMHLHVLDFIPPQSLEHGDDEFEVRRVQSPVDTSGPVGPPTTRRR